MKENLFSINNNETLLQETFNSEFDVIRGGGDPHAGATSVTFTNGVGYFDGVTAEIAYSRANYRFGEPEDAFSIRARVYMTDVDGSVFAQVYTTAGPWEFRFYIGTGAWPWEGGADKLMLELYDTAGTAGAGNREMRGRKYNTQLTTSCLNRWAEFVCTYDGRSGVCPEDGIALYMDGDRVDDTDISESAGGGDYQGMEFSSSLPLQVGRNLEGQMDLLEIYNYVLTAEEVSNMFENKRHRELSIISPSKITTLSKSLYSTATTGYPIFAQGTNNNSPLMYYYNNKTYGVWMQRPGVGYGCESMVYAVDHTTDVVSASYGVGPGRAAGTDSHAFPAVIVADDGHIIIAHERLKNDNPSSGHNSIMEIKRSDNVEDETSWVNAIAHNANFYTTVGDEAFETLCYPKLYKLTNGNIILFARCHLEKVRLYISADNGISFNAGNDVVDLSISYAYNLQPERGTTSQIDVIVRRYNTGTLLADEVYYLKSVDGGTTWTDVAGGGSKDIVATSALTMAELQADKYRVCSDIPNGVTAIAAVMIDANTPYIIASNGTGATRPLSVYEYSGGVWNEHVTGIDEPHCPINLIYDSSSNTLDIIKRSVSGSDYVTRRYRASMSDLTSWAILEDNIWVRPDSETYSLFKGHYTFNYVETSSHIFTSLYDVDASYNDFYIALIESFSGYKDVLHLSANSGVITDRWENTLNLTGMSIFKNGDVRVNSFDGLTSFIEVLHSSVFNFDGDKPFSVSCWIKRKDKTEFPIVAKGIYNTNAEYRVLIDSSGIIHNQVFDDSVADCYLGKKYNTALPVGRWIHIVCTYDGLNVVDGLKIYIYGELVTVIDSSNNAGSYEAMEALTADVHIGRNDALYAKGYMDEVRIHGGELDAYEVSQLFSSTKHLYLR